MDSAKKLLDKNKNGRQFIKQAQGPEGPLDGVFGPLSGLMEGKEGAGSNGNLSFRSSLARVTQMRLKLQQVTSAPDPQAMSQMLARAVFQGKAIDLTDTRDYGSFGCSKSGTGMEWIWSVVVCTTAGSGTASGACPGCGQPQYPLADNHSRSVE